MSSAGFSFSPDRLRTLASDALAHARAKGATACEVDISEGFGQTVGVRRGAVDTIEYNRDKGFGITVYAGQQRGHASSSDFSPAALQATVEAALSIARFTAADPFAGLPDADRLARDVADLDLFHPWALGVEQAIELAQECEAAAFAVSPQISNSEGASVSTQQNQFVKLNSDGFAGGYATSYHGLSCSVIAGEGDAMQREYWYDSRRQAERLDSAASIGRRAGERALARLGARKIATTEAPVLFEAPLAASLIGSLVQATSGGALYRKASFLLDSAGTQVMAPLVTIREQPHLPGEFGCTRFDDEGVATAPRDVVLDGMLQGYFLSSYSARKLGLPTTANAGGAHRLIVEPTVRGKQGVGALPALLRQMGRGLLVTELLGHGINIVNGDYSRGAAGFWVENGEIAYPVEEITIAGNLAEMFRSIVAIGDDTLPRSARQCGSILIERMTIAGN